RSRRTRTAASRGRSSPSTSSRSTRSPTGCPPSSACRSAENKNPRTSRGFGFAGGERGLVALALHTLAHQLAGPADGLGALAGAALGGLLVVAAELHLSEDAFALHLLLQDAQRLIDVVFTNENLHFDRFLPCMRGHPGNSPGAIGRRRRCHSAEPLGRRCGRPVGLLDLPS